MRTLPVGAAFGHMLRSTTNNLGFAWQLSWPWILLIAPANILATLYGFTLEPRADGSVPEGKVIAIHCTACGGSHVVCFRIHRRELAPLRAAGRSAARMGTVACRQYGLALLRKHPADHACPGRRNGACDAADRDSFRNGQRWSNPRGTDLFRHGDLRHRCLLSPEREAAGCGAGTVRFRIEGRMVHHPRQYLATLRPGIVVCTLRACHRAAACGRG